MDHRDMLPEPRRWRASLVLDRPGHRPRRPGDQVSQSAPTLRRAATAGGIDGPARLGHCLATPSAEDQGRSGIVSLEMAPCGQTAAFSNSLRRKPSLLPETEVSARHSIRRFRTDSGPDSTRHVIWRVLSVQRDRICVSQCLWSLSTLPLVNIGIATRSWSSDHSHHRRSSNSAMRSSSNLLRMIRAGLPPTMA